MLTDYGPIFEVWHDGANGGDGYYGGAREKRAIDKNTYYDWPRTWELVRRLQPEAVIFSDVGPGRALGGQRARHRRRSMLGHLRSGGRRWRPGVARQRAREGIADRPRATARTGCRPNATFRSAPAGSGTKSENARVKTPADSIALYYRFRGPRRQPVAQRAAQSRRFALARKISRRSRRSAGWRHATFARNLAAGARVTAANARAPRERFGPQHLLDGREDTYWATDDATLRAEAVFDFAAAGDF